MPLTDRAIRNAKPGKKPLRMFDGGGLYIEVAPSGGKWWRFKYRFGGKEKRLSLGVYPDVPLASRTEANKETGKLVTIKGARERLIVIAGHLGNDEGRRRSAYAAVSNFHPLCPFIGCARKLRVILSVAATGFNVVRIATITFTITGFFKGLLPIVHALN